MSKKILRKQFDHLIIDSNFSGEHILLEDIPEVIKKVKLYVLNLYSVDYEGEGTITELFRSYDKKECDEAYELLKDSIGYYDKLEIEELHKPKFSSLKKIKKSLKRS